MTETNQAVRRNIPGWAMSPASRSKSSKPTSVRTWDDLRDYLLTFNEWDRKVRAEDVFLINQFQEFEVPFQFCVHDWMENPFTLHDKVSALEKTMALNPSAVLMVSSFDPQIIELK